ncbi:GNAT family N-acetyltransferase [Krasilnikoviella flava]|uniref:Phosphinothricin acetyltransferase n=1 Tax=Krasilnikoviella flava TaxID=526729 RepID=A0A1T5L5G5_9MICO|nr:GNAT family N-acetyltransferase [Krasilnikoviella flava]SKC71287.1 phosphinothricin acetyltransferase [Krasilnikoviella flava]
MPPLPSPTGPTTTPGPLVRAAVADDLPTIASILEPYVTSTAVTFDEQAPDATAWRQRLADLDARGLPFLVAELDGAVVGYAYAAPWRPKAAYRYTVENTIYLAPAVQGRGVGTRLLSALLDACALAGVRQVVAVVADDPAAAGSLPLHRRLGFEVAGVLRDVGVKHGRTVSTMLLQRTLA